MIDMVTIVGRVATDPTQAQTGGGVPVTNFRLASTHRRFDAATQEWTDSGTNWFSVAAFRSLGDNVKASLRTGDSVIVTGRLKIRNWESNGKHGTSVDIDADSIGHDLRWGTTAYRPQSRPAAAGPSATPTAEAHRPEESEEDEPGPEQAMHDSEPLDLSWATPAAGAMS
jgi:single-strand DNA-binding protein